MRQLSHPPFPLRCWGLVHVDGRLIELHSYIFAATIRSAFPGKMVMYHVVTVTSEFSRTRAQEPKHGYTIFTP